jgi:protein SCO1/2
MKSLIILTSFVAAALTDCGPSEPPLPTYGMVPEFHLTAHSGEEFSSKKLDGKIWVADFMFTNCPGPCPRMTTQMRTIQQAFPNESDIRFVSFTVDPDRDTPEVLEAYARRYKADLSTWYFLTGPVQKLHQLKRETFLLGDVNGVSFEHSTRFVLVDGDGRIRGFYPTAEPSDIDKLIADIRKLIDTKV